MAEQKLDLENRKLYFFRNTCEEIGGRDERICYEKKGCVNCPIWKDYPRNNPQEIDRENIFMGSF